MKKFQLKIHLMKFMIHMINGITRLQLVMLKNQNSITHLTNSSKKFPTVTKKPNKLNNGKKHLKLRKAKEETSVIQISQIWNQKLEIKPLIMISKCWRVIRLLIPKRLLKRMVLRIIKRNIVIVMIMEERMIKRHFLAMLIWKVGN